MQQWNAYVYELNGQFYRRNVPLECLPSTNSEIEAHFSEAYEDGDDYIVAALENIPWEGDAGHKSDDEHSIGDPIEDVPSKIKEVKYHQRRKVFYGHVDMPTQLVNLLDGKHGSDLFVFSYITRCDFDFMASDQSADVTTVEIYDKDCDGVRHGLQEMRLMIAACRDRLPPTHFVCMPLWNDRRLRGRFLQLCRQIQQCDLIQKECREPILFRSPDKICVKICDLRLLTEADERQAKECLQHFFDETIPKIMDGERSLRVTLTGLTAFDEPRFETSTVHVRVKSEKLQKIANAIEMELTQIGLTGKNKSKNVRTGMTLLSTESDRKIDAYSVFEAFERAWLPKTTVDEVQINAVGTSGCLASYRL